MYTIHNLLGGKIPQNHFSRTDVWEGNRILAIWSTTRANFLLRSATSAWHNNGMKNQSNNIISGRIEYNIVHVINTIVVYRLII